MSVIATIILCLFLLVNLSQFGGRLSARHSLSWWLAAIFMVVAASFPEVFRPLVDFLGIQVVSNFVLATLVAFLFIQLLDLTSEISGYSRKMRRFVSAEAADRFVSQLMIGESHVQGRKRVLVVLPTYNEEDNLPQSIAAMDELLVSCSSDVQWEYLYCFVNDGSIDRTEVILKSRAAHRYVTHRTNLGVSGVLMTGFSIASSLNCTYVVQCDADGQHPFSEIPNLVRLAHQNRADLTIGSRFTLLNGGSLKHRLGSTTLQRYLGIRLISSILSVFGRKAFVTDPTSGFRVYSQKAIAILQISMPDEYPEPESIPLLATKGACIQEVPVRMLPRAAGVSSLQGLKSFRFIVKVATAILALRIRTMLP